MAVGARTMIVLTPFSFQISVSNLGVYIIIVCCVTELESDSDNGASNRTGRSRIGDRGDQSGGPAGRSDGERSGSVGRQTAPCTRRRVRAARYDRLGPASRTNSIDRPTSSIILLVFARLAIAEATARSSGGGRGCALVRRCSVSRPKRTTSIILFPALISSPSRRPVPPANIDRLLSGVRRCSRLEIACQCPQRSHSCAVCLLQKLCVQNYKHAGRSLFRDYRVRISRGRSFYDYDALCM